MNKSKTSENPKKILMIGLDNSGKTSISKCLQGIKNLSAFNSIVPTRDPEIEDFEALNSRYVIWDLSGQETYREEYLDQTSKFFGDTSKIIYVIDIQDVKRYEIALEYMEKVIRSVDNNKDIDFSIFLHKYDPDLKFDQKLNENIIDKLIKRIKEKISPNFNFSLHKTSIYAIFEKSTII
ncbi:MAG: ADP-ribosylation factor-like protein [Promethearchaeota archaeon]|jgi:GTPase SAR1 family protein